MKYSDLSDFEINKKAFLLGVKLGYFDFEDIMQNKNPNCNAVMYGDGLNWHKWDGCNRANDAWPIMRENGIATMAEGGKLVGATTDSYETYEAYGNVVHTHYDKNPLRAAMIVFLMMNEGETK